MLTLEGDRVKEITAFIGPSGCGKSTFARRHFKPTEVLSSDYCRGLVSDNENSMSATKDAFEVLHFIAAKRLALGRLTVVDATNQHDLPVVQGLTITFTVMVIVVNLLVDILYSLLNPKVRTE
mgnify:CR=1 FL=1